MKKILFCILLLMLPCFAHADLEVFLSNQNLPHSKGLWTSNTSPDSGSAEIKVDPHPYREEFPSAYEKTPGEIQSLIYGLYPSLNATDRQARYNSVVNFNTQNLLQYLAIALSPNTESDINDKASAGFQLSPFESVFQSCSINITQRENIIRTLINNIHSGTYTSVKDMQYSDIRFGDCIIPFPDTRRNSSVIVDSFPSNKVAAKALWGNPLDFGTLEDDIDLVSLKNVNTAGLYSQLQENNTLQLSSTHVDSTTNFDKTPGENNILFIHQNHKVNPFWNALISGDIASWYNIAGNSFNPSHPLFIRESDSEEKRSILSWWRELQPGIYIKTLLQEDNFELQSWVYIPKQSVGASSYYAVVYNYDITAPSCVKTLFSHENAGKENFILSENMWFHTKKYGYFVCWDGESWCACDSASGSCFIKDNTVLSLPKTIGHGWSISHSFENKAGISNTCNTVAENKIFYDTLTVNISVTGTGALTHEYVSNNGTLYDGVQVVWKKIYKVREKLEFQAGSTPAFGLQFVDPYDSGRSWEWVAGLKSIDISISKFEWSSWVQKITNSNSFADYNQLGTKNTQDSYDLDLSTIPNIQDISEKIGQYQISVNAQDSAGNLTRMILYFNILPWPIDVSKSILSTTGKNTLYANNTSSYTYTLSLKDSYWNPIAGRNVSWAQISCSSIGDCKEVLLNMSQNTPSWWQALEIHTIDSISDTNGNIEFSLRSKAPGEFSEGFEFDFLSPDESHIFVWETNSFLAPFEWVLETKDGTNWLDDTLLVGSEAEYRLKLINKASMSVTWALNNFSSFLVGRHPQTSFNISGSLNTQSDGVYFNGTFTSSLSDEESHKTLLEIIDTNVSGVIISYILGWENVRYRLHTNHQNSELLTLGNTGELENPVKIIGQLQWVWNSQNLSERQNFTQLNSNTLRNNIRKNIWKHINGRTSNSTVWGIRYIDKTNSSNKLYSLPSNPNFETLIVRNGNIRISSNFNGSKKKVGIISYNDRWYNKETGYNDTGNIYIEYTVSSVNAFMYADGALISTKSGSPIEGSVNARIDTKNSILPNQLKISGALFSRNTLAGGRELAGAYMLPGEEKTTNRALAVQYDLYYTRRWNAWCETDAYDFCNIPHYMIIKYDARVQTSPPKLFQTGQ